MTSSPKRLEITSLDWLVIVAASVSLVVVLSWRYQNRRTPPVESED